MENSSLEPAAVLAKKKRVYTPEQKARALARSQTPARRASSKAWRNTPEQIAVRAAKLERAVRYKTGEITPKRAAQIVKEQARNTSEFRAARAIYLKEWKERPGVRERLAEQSRARNLKQPLVGAKTTSCTRCGVDVTYYGSKVLYCAECGAESHKESHGVANVAYKKRNRRAQQDADNLRYRTDFVYNLQYKLRRRVKAALRYALKGGKKQDTTMKLLGCTFAEFAAYLEDKFTEGMSIEACFDGRIHLDHIRPVSSFDLFDVAQQRTCFHYTNLQPLWARDNLIKSDKWDPTVEPFPLAA